MIKTNLTKALQLVMIISMEIEKYLRTFKSSSHPCKVEVDGVMGWVKFAAPARHSRGENLIAKVLRIPMLRFCGNPGGEKGLNQEITKYKNFKKAQEWVPDVLRESHDLMWLSDMGETLESIIDEMSAVQKKSAVQDVTRALARLHRKGLMHGAPMLRNIIVEKDKVGWIDLEETPELVMISNRAYARDLLLWIWSVSKCKALGDEYIQLIVRSYQEHGEKEVFIPIKRIIKLARKIDLVLGWVLGHLGRDLAVAIRVIRVMVKLV